MGEAFDVIIVGGGPAGAAAALVLAKAGRKVCLLERLPAGRQKSCGDGLMPDAQKALERLELWGLVSKEAYNMKKAIFYFPKGKPLSTSLTFTTIKRARLDATLLKSARTNGAAIRYNSLVTSITEEGENVHVHVDGRTLAAPYVILATGMNISLAKAAEVPVNMQASGVAIRAYCKLAKPLDSVVVFFERELMPGYGWIFPLNEAEANIGVGYSLDDTPRERDVHILLKHFRESPRVKEYLQGDVFDVSAAPLRAGLSTTFAKNRILLCGENIHATCNLIGEGVGKALWSGIFAAESILAGGNVGETYSGRVRDSFSAVHEGYNELTKAFRRPLVRALLRSEIATNAGISLMSTKRGKQLIADVYNEKKSAQELASGRKILKNVLF